MNITLQTIKFKESEELKEFVNEKVGKLFHTYPEAIRVDVTLKESAKNDPSNKWCELYLSHKGDNKIVKRNADSYESSILLSVEAMEKILRRLKS